MSDDQLLFDPEVIPASDAPVRSSNGGRPPGAKNKFSSREFWALAKGPRGLRVIEGLMTRAEKLNDPNWTPNAEDMRAALFIAGRLLHRQPLEIDVQHGFKSDELLEAVASGEISAVELGQLLRSAESSTMLARSGISAAAESDAKAVLLDKLTKVAADRARREAAPSDALDAAAPITASAEPAATVPGAQDRAADRQETDALTDDQVGAELDRLFTELERRKL